MKLIIFCVGLWCSIGLTVQTKPQFDSVMQVSFKKIFSSKSTIYFKKFYSTIFYTEILNWKVDLRSSEVPNFFSQNKREIEFLLTFFCIQCRKYLI